MNVINDEIVNNENSSCHYTSEEIINADLD